MIGAPVLIPCCVVVYCGFCIRQGNVKAKSVCFIKVCFIGVLCVEEGKRRLRRKEAVACWVPRGDDDVPYRCSYPAICGPAGTCSWGKGWHSSHQNPEPEEFAVSQRCDDSGPAIICLYGSRR